MKVIKMTNTSKDNDFPLTICDEVKIDLRQIPNPFTGQIDYVARDINNHIFCQFDFEIVATEEVEEKVKRQEVVGQIHLIGLNNAVRSMEQVLLEDAFEMSDAARECFKAITNEDGDYKESFKSKLNLQHNLVGGLLFLDMIGVNTYFQKFDVSIDLLDTICTMFQPFYDAILLTPAPIQYLTIDSDREDPVHTNGNEFGDVHKTTAKQKLVKHFKKAGFELFESKYVMFKKL